MDYDERNALFRAHAAAVLTGDTAEADRTHRLIYPDHLMAHQVFVPALFATCVVDHFGDELDWSRLDVFIGELRSEYPDVSPLKTEALIRVMYGESLLYFEVPVAELRGAGHEYRPPCNFLEVEGLVRGLRGESRLIGEISDDRLPQSLRFLLRYLYETEPEIREDFDEVLEKARGRVLRRVIGVRTQHADIGGTPHR